MTRETKIGLLVGLAFIIVVGILLSEHLTTTIERPQAQLADAGKTVREGVSAPGAQTNATDAPVRAAEPTATIPMPQEIRPQTSGAAHVAIGGPTAQSPIVIDNHAAPAGNNVAPVTPTGPTQSEITTSINGQPISQGPIVMRTPTDPFANSPLQQAAKSAGESLVPANPIISNTKTDTTLAANNAREYQAQPGDSLARIAALLPGGATKANRDAIVKLNPMLQKDPNKVIAGRKYLLPTETALIATQTPAPTPAPLVQQPTVVEKKAEPVKTETAKSEAPSLRTYVVQKGDTLTKIAIEQLGSKSEVGTIRELNKEALKNGDVIRVDMKLKLPAKQQVAANQ